MLNNKRAEISFVENKYNIKLNFCIDKDATSDSYSIEKIKLSDKYKSLDLDDAPVLQDTSEIYNEFSDNNKSMQSKSKQKIERISNVSTSTKTEVKAEDPEIANEDQPDAQEKTATKKRRQNRNRKRIAKKSNAQSTNNSNTASTPEQPSDDTSPVIKDSVEKTVN